MDQLRLPAVAARVVAWHNRHPLARRIAAAEVVSIGYVSLPYARRLAAGGADASGEPVLDEVIAEAPAGGLSLRERAMARARSHAGAAARAAAGGAAVAARAGWKRAFVEDFIPPLKPRAIARWARRHGVTLAMPPEDGPLREVRGDALPAGHGPATLYVLTAAIESGGRRHRVLLGAGLAPAVLGPRMWSRARLGAVAGALLVGLLGGGWFGLRPAPAPEPVAAAAPADTAEAPKAAASAAEAPAHAEAEAEPASGAAPHGTAVAEAAPGLAAPAADDDPAPGEQAEPPPRARHGGVAHEPAASAAAAPAPHDPPASPAKPPALAKNPLAAYPRRGRVELPNPREMLSDEQKQAAVEEREALGLPRRAATPRAPAAAAARPGAGPAAAVAAADPASPRPVPRSAPPPGAPAFAVSTRPLRTRTEADQVRVAMTALLAGAGADGAVVEVLPQGEDWRVVGWPFDNRGDADKARALLASRGMRVEVVAF